MTPDTLIAGGQKSVDNEQAICRPCNWTTASTVGTNRCPLCRSRRESPWISQQRIVVTLENGQVLCFGPGSE